MQAHTCVRRGILFSSVLQLLVKIFFFCGFDFDIEFLPSQTLWTYFIFVNDGGHFKRMGLKEEQCTVRH